MTMYEATHVLGFNGRAPAAVLRLVERHLKASHDVVEPQVEAFAGKVGVTVHVGALNPFFAVSDGARAVALALRDAGWALGIDPLEVTVTPRPSGLTVVQVGASR